MIKQIYTPTFVDGVKMLHSQLNAVDENSSKLLKEILGISNISLLFYFERVDQQQDLKLKGYRYSNGTVMRFLPIELDYAVVFPVMDHCSRTIFSEGITYKELIHKINSNNSFWIIFRRCRNTDIPIYKSMFPKENGRWKLEILDDFGNIVSKFPDIDSLAIIDVPYKYISRTYTLVDKQHYAPYTTLCESYCVLFAELCNKSDANAIKVLRWLPIEKFPGNKQQLRNTVHKGADVFFEMGYISRHENTELHRFMVENHSRILFGKKIGDEIIIMGSVKIFLSNNFRYPKCLYNIKLI
jgi:hypothetical protein